MAHPFPSEAWTQAFKDAVNRNEKYRKHGQAWTYGAVAMVIRRETKLDINDDTAMILDVHQGSCRDANLVRGMDAAMEADFVLVAPYSRWKEVIQGQLDPIKGMMEGKLKMEKGHLPTMLRFVESSRALVVSAADVPTQFPDET